MIIASSSAVMAQSYSEEKAKAIVTEMDDNADKKVDFQEFYQESVTDNQDSYDSNHDGYITSGEVALEIKEDLIDTVTEMNRLGVSEHDADLTIVNTLNTVEQRADAIVKQMDSDGDNLVEEEELKAYQRKQFDALDKNKDGFLSAADVEKKSKHKGFPIRLK